MKDKEKFANANEDEIVKESVESTVKENTKPKKDKKFTGIYEVYKPKEWEEKSILEKIDIVKSADLVFDKGGIQIYKSDEATVMIKILQYDPLKFEAIYAMKGAEEPPEEMEEEMEEEIEEVSDISPEEENAGV